MTNLCLNCNKDYDDARCSTICPHSEFLTVEEAKQKDLAFTLLGKRVYFAHRPAGVEPVRVQAVSRDGMIEIAGFVGEFAPHLFVLAEEDPFPAITCECGEVWTQEMHTVCPKCASWPRSPAL